jgi:hypothetical protein
MSDAYSFDDNVATPTDPQQRRRLYLQRLQQAANATALLSQCRRDAIGTSRTRLFFSGPYLWLRCQ